jgi:hypothetical protein
MKSAVIGSPINLIIETIFSGKTEAFKSISDFKEIKKMGKMIGRKECKGFGKLSLNT